MMPCFQKRNPLSERTFLYPLKTIHFDNTDITFLQILISLFKNEALPALPCVACAMPKCVGVDAEKRMSRLF